MDGARGAELKAFLRRMRARLAPEDVGLPAAERRRRTPGLRIEEAAALAGVSLTWYSALESGKGSRVSANLLDRVADTLRLNRAERELLVKLAGPVRDVASPAADYALLQTIVEGFTAGPACVVDQFWNVRAYNVLAGAVYGWENATEQNLLIRMLTEPGFRRLHSDWEATAMQMVAMLHLSFARAPENASAIELVARLRKMSAEFPGWWDAYQVSRFIPMDAVLQHPELGQLRLKYSSFVESAAHDTDDPAILLLQPAADEATRELFRRLLRVSAEQQPAQSRG
jgi:transcriptional regulator with XRE-family HTH domain